MGRVRCLTIRRVAVCGLGERAVFEVEGNGGPADAAETMHVELEESPGCCLIAHGWRRRWSWQRVTVDKHGFNRDIYHSDFLNRRGVDVEGPLYTES